MAFRASGFNFDFGKGFEPPPMLPNPTGNENLGRIAEETFQNFAGFNRAYQGNIDTDKLIGEAAASRAKYNAQTILDNAFAKAQVATANSIKEQLEKRRDEIKDNIQNDVDKQNASNWGSTIGTVGGAIAGSVFPGVGTALGATAGGGIGKFIGGLFG